MAMVTSPFLGRIASPLSCVSSSKVIVVLVVVPNNNINEEKKHNNGRPMIHEEPIVEEPQEVALRRS